MAFDLKEEYILDAEEKLGAILPMTYKQIMKQNNGGTIYLDEDDWELFPIEDKLDKKRISRTCNHIVHETNIAKEWANFPTQSLAIASDGCGNLLILKQEDNKYLNEVYIWDHETFELKQVANDFSELEIE